MLLCCVLVQHLSCPLLFVRTSKFPSKASLLLLSYRRIQDPASHDKTVIEWICMSSVHSLNSFSSCVCVSSPGMEINNADRPQCCQPQVSFLSLLFMHPYKNQCHSSYCSYTFVFNLSPSSTYTLMPLTVSTKACSWL